MILQADTHHPLLMTHHSRHPLVLLAAQAVEAFVRNREIIAPPVDFFEQHPEAHRRAGAFVCLKARGQLRGCIGTTEPSRETLAVEIVENAVAAAARDPRFEPVRPDELAELAIIVDVLSTPEPVADETRLDHRRYGVIVRSGARHGVLLPDIEHINSVREQVATARLKAGIGSEEPAELFRFEVERYQ
jgi:AmmeMemoRadiSam system protein A